MKPITVRTVRALVDRAREAKVPFLAASIAYYAAFSIIPMLLLVLATGSIVGGQAWADRLVGSAVDLLSSEGRAVVEDALTDPSGRGGASIVGLVGLLWSGLRMFRGIDVAFDEVYQAETATPVWRQILNGVITLTSIGVSISILIGLGAVIRRVEPIDVPGIQLLSLAGVVVGLVIVLLPIFYIMPPIDVTVREIVPGTVFTVIGWFVLQAAFRLYATYAVDYQAYGILGAALLFLAWLYFAGILVLLGATINAVLAGR